MTAKCSIDIDAIPAALRQRDQWVCWRAEERDGKQTKVPVTPEKKSFASATDPDTWTAFDAARGDVAAGNADGVGFVFTDDDPIVGVDLDDCRDPETGDVDDTARDIIERLDSYTEISPSGTGYHVLVTGDLPDGRNRRGSVELYDTARFFTVTGDHVDVTPRRVARRQDALKAIHREYIQETESDKTSEADRLDPVAEDASEPAVDVDLEDEELLQKARNASNGKKFERLWSGDTTGYDSHSEADMALCYLLAFWTGGDRMRIERLFRQSGLHREKWDDVHYADGSTYGEKTIERAIANTSEFYDPDAGNESTHTSTNTAESSVDATRDESGRSRTYLTEKNRLLTERVDELEATLEQKTERIGTLEAEIKRLNAELAARDREAEHTQEEQSTTTSENEVDSEVPSVWRRLFGSHSK
ncbi:phage NrS-1 polymerase family protein [Halomarina ordinaria]|uniref:NrS-1 polymerase-like HBD domain-containing protein n=1 Tax=Halomarina ordinaria TaxID=3033939 RepID=A0ABD5UAI2_9EURY|nr:hypothetical protein [Halomarina sp. PSRA2]